MDAVKPKSYCEFVKNIDQSDPHRIYHDNEYGFVINSDNDLFGRLILEINQAGLSWITILKKKENFKIAYSSFDIKKIANYRDADIDRLLNDEGIIRNKLKINAAIFNANGILEIKKTHGSFKAWLDENRILSLQEWVKLFKRTFKFTGGEITKEFLISTGYLKGAHDVNCPIYDKVIQENPRWKTSNY